MSEQTATNLKLVPATLTQQETPSEASYALSVKDGALEVQSSRRVSHRAVDELKQNIDELVVLQAKLSSMITDLEQLLG